MDLAVATVIVVRVFLVVTMLGIGVHLGLRGVALATVSRTWLAIVLAVNLVLMPAAGTAVCLLLGLRGEVAVGLLACTIAPAGSLAPKLVHLSDGDLRRGIAATFLLSALATLTVPITIPFAAAAMGIEAATSAIDVGAVMVTLATYQLLPMVVGVALARRRALALRLARPLTRMSNALIVAIVVVALLDTADDIVQVGPWPMIGMASVALIGHAVGWLVGGPDGASRRAAAVVSAQRSPGLALLVVAGPGHPVATATVVVATLALTAVNIGAAVLYGRRPDARSVEVGHIDATT